MPRQGGEPERGRRALDDPHGAVPELVRAHPRLADARPVGAVKERPDAGGGGLDLVGPNTVGERWRAVGGQVAAHLAAVQRRGAPHVAPRREGDAEGPPARGAEPAFERGAAGHAFPITPAVWGTHAPC